MHVEAPNHKAWYTLVVVHMFHTKISVDSVQANRCHPLLPGDLTRCKQDEVRRFLGFEDMFDFSLESDPYIHSCTPQGASGVSDDLQSRGQGD